MTQKLFNDFEVYSRALIASKDVDPTYPAVKAIVEEYGFEPEWFVFVYVAFYNLGTAIRVCEAMPTRQEWDRGLFRGLREKHPHFGHERRGSSRNVDVMMNHLEASMKLITQAQAEEVGVANTGLIDTNAQFRKSLEALPNVGGWASFKIAELFEKALGYNSLAIPDLGLEGRDPNSNDGPIGGLRWLTGRECYYTKDFYEPWNSYGAALAEAWGVDIGEVETAFCKWHKFKSGKYFVGHDIQEFCELYHIMGVDRYRHIMFDECGFDRRFLLDGNTFRLKLQKELKPHYKNTGEILNRDFAELLPKIDALDIFMSI